MTNRKKWDISYRQKHKEEILIRQKVWNSKNSDKNRKYRKKYRKTTKGRYQIYKWRAKKKEIEFCLTFKEFEKITNSNCHYCGDSSKIGVDRKNNKEGYTNENSLPCCWRCNKFKSVMDYDFFVKNCKEIGDHLSKI